MPIYEYACPKCGQFELSRRITDPPLKRCPTCRSGVKKLISQTSFQLKGSGWYVTDYGRKNGGEAKESKSEGSSTKTDSSSKSESKPSSDSTSSSESKSSTDSKSTTKNKSDRGTQAAA